MLIPLKRLPTSSNRESSVTYLNTSAEGQLQAWLKNNMSNNDSYFIQDLPQESEQRSSISNRLSELERELERCQLTSKPAIRPPFLYSLIPAVIANFEIAMRPSAFLIPSLPSSYAQERQAFIWQVLSGAKDKDITCIRILWNSIIHFERQKRATEVGHAQKLLAAILQRHMFGNATFFMPLLSTDVFGVLVRYSTLKMIENESDEWDKNDSTLSDIVNATKLLNVANLLQAILSVLQQVIADKNTDYRKPLSTSHNPQQSSGLLQLCQIVLQNLKAISPSDSLGDVDALLSSGSWPLIEAEIRELALPFMYRTAIFYYTCLGYNFAEKKVECTGEEDEYGFLEALLSLPTLDSVRTSFGDQIFVLVDKWLQDYLAFLRKEKSGTQGEDSQLNALLNNPLLVPALPFELCR